MFSRPSSNLLSKSNIHGSRECHNQKYIQGMHDRIENFFEVGLNFTDDGSFCYLYLRFHRNACENDFSLMGVK